MIGSGMCIALSRGKHSAFGHQAGSRISSSFVQPVDKPCRADHAADGCEHGSSGLVRNETDWDVLTHHLGPKR
jgi:hypothetical protein